MAEQEYVTREDVEKIIQDMIRKEEDIEDRIKNYFLGRKDKAIFNALKNLIDDERIDVILCIYRDGMTVAETGVELEISERTVRRHKRRLLDTIKKLC